MKDVNTKIKGDDLKDMYAAYREMDLPNFRLYVRKLISNARAPNQSILRKINTMSKDQLVIAASNFGLKGQGFGAIK